MCGLAGIYNNKGLDRSADDAVKRMAAMLQHRGPDESGIYIDDFAALGHSRLSIIDPQGGSQPITNKDGTLWIVFNGEIFNYHSIRAKLLEAGHIFNSNCDTEVLLHLFEEKGESCLNELNGQFAFAVWDSVKKELFLARDHTGIVPMFYTITPEGKFIFGSEIKAILSEGTVDRNINPKALEQVFTLWTTLPGQTFFKNIQELPPASYIKISGGKISLRKYWDLNFSDTDSELNYSIPSLVEEIKEVLIDAVRVRLRADVPVGCYLSGGIDSSGVTALIRNNFNNDLRTFGITFEDADYNERDYQQMMVSHLGVNHTEQFVSNDDIADHFCDAVYNIEKPVLRTAPVPLYMLSRKVRDEGYKVVLSGEGADEIFGGYNIFKETLIRKFWSAYPDSRSRFILLQRLYPYIFKDKRLRNSLIEFFRAGIDNPANPYFSHQIRWKNTSKIKNFFSPHLYSSNENYDPVNELENFIPGNFSSWSALAKAQYIEILLFMSGYLLSSQGDRMAMAHSVELRIPYLDYRIMELLAKIPYSLKIRGLNEKYLLKKVFEKDLPQKILKRPKNPYRAPINYLFRGKSNRNMDYVSGDALKESGFFNPQKVALLIKKMNNSTVGEVDSMAAAGILSTQAIYYRFIKDFDLSFKPVFINKVYDHRKTTERAAHGL